MKTILRAAKYTVSPDQLAMLYQLYGEDINLVQKGEKGHMADQIIMAMDIIKPDILILDNPLDRAVLAELIDARVRDRPPVPVLRSVCEVVRREDGSTVRVFSHFEQLTGFQFETKKLELAPISPPTDR